MWGGLSVAASVTSTFAFRGGIVAWAAGQALVYAAMFAWNVFRGRNGGGRVRR